MAANVTTMKHPAARFAAGSSMESTLARARESQVRWSGLPLSARLEVIRNARHAIAARSEELAASLPPELNRNIADTLVAEVLPLAAACRFLESEAPALLRPARLGRAGRPLWLHGVHSEIQRVPVGLVLLIAPSNYPLFLPGVQTLQAIAAGNSVLWKPAAGGETVARAFARLLADSGLPEQLLQVLDTSHQAGIDAIRAGVDKVFLTGHADTGRAVMHELAAKLTPSVMELSGCDSVFVLPGADLERTAHALAFGMRLNGSATCMAPRKVFASASMIEKLVACLMPKLERLAPVALAAKVTSLLDSLLREAEQHGAIIARDGRSAHGVTPTVVLHAHPDHAIMQTDIFAPLLSFCAVPDLSTALRFNAQSPYALTAAIFGPEAEAVRLAGQLRAGTVLINDLIVSTADPRVPFGGRGQSGFGVTRGREGLLEMTTTKTILRQKSRSLRPYAPTGAQHQEFFSSFIQTLHAGSLAAKYHGLRRFITAARTVDKH